MIVAETVLKRGDWPEPAADTVTLDETARHRRRMAMVSDGGIAFMLDLAEAERLNEGDALLLEDGRLVEVRARPEPLLDVRADSPQRLLELAWHVGNRHLAAEIEADRLLIRRDPVIAEMLRGLGATVEEIEAPFAPVGGAYAASHDDGDHGHHE